MPGTGIWYCKIGSVSADRLPDGCDFPMRRAVEKAYKEITGEDPKYIFSGWGAHLTEGEQEVVNG